jgi:hypothetical protein
MEVKSRATKLMIYDAWCLEFSPHSTKRMPISKVMVVCLQLAFPLVVLSYFYME